jgi:hypothetical protein
MQVYYNFRIVKFKFIATDENDLCEEKVFVNRPYGNGKYLI